jgi:hypothetical protein
MSSKYNKFVEVIKIVETMSSQDVGELVLLLKETKHRRQECQQSIRAKWLVSRKDLHPVCKT